MPEAEPQPRVALITGGSKGLGAGLVEAYLDAGYCVETCSRSSTDQVKAWESDPDLKERFHFAAADVSKREEADRFVKDAAKRWGRIDVLVNNAGVARDGVIALFSDDDLDTVVDLNLKGTVYVTRTAKGSQYAIYLRRPASAPARKLRSAARSSSPPTAARSRAASARAA